MDPFKFTKLSSLATPPPARPLSDESNVAPRSPGESVARMHIKLEASAGALVVDSTH